jgi:sulfhydrogenase subunit beta (sulfur reductase)
MSVLLADKCTVVRADLDALFPAIRKAGFETLGPTLRDGALVIDTIESTRDLPTGWTDEQSPGSYRLRRRTDEALFAYAVGPTSWKRFLHHPAIRLFQIRSQPETGWTVVSDNSPPPKLAFIGMRACELHALSIRDRVLLKGKYAEPDYKLARENVFIASVNCSHPAAMCFCTSMNAGPRCPDGFDLAITEILEGGHRFLIEVGTEKGRAVLQDVPHREATDLDLDDAENVINNAKASIRKTLDTRGLKQLLFASVEHPTWERVARRCMACSNCTMSCPTCFCTNFEDSSDVTGETAERWRYWDSCFSQQYSYIHGGSVRNSGAARYRHFLLHKFASWWDQFGTSGCVGCGRCITWCPAGIDITEEIRGIRESARGGWS